ncbi:DUF6603 domain-containing protein [Sphingomonas sp. HF-S4]|uniref:DUF6603 domain-containing protein n=1 Tax=Sphingomonas agrestis TaxID=3080540 RepID=A0ABU3Y8R3_9SPHN|nr:DUF6603 domain-containing protein [Sphingomonas sp. HF-S4]MDV3457682.1 DUF6603 domain-containing protein [Sphingomonas sp. HF-S4]
MSTIDAITAAIDKLPTTGGVLTLTPADFNLDFMNSVFTRLLATQSLSFAGVQITPGTETIVIAGTATIFDYADLDCTLSFTVAEGNTVATLTGKFATSRQITLPLLTWLKAGNISISTSFTESLEIVALAFGMDILLQNGDTIPILVTQLTADVWRIDIAEGTAKGVTGDDLVFLLGGQALENFLPPALTGELAGFTINGMEAELDTAAKSVTYFSTGVAVTNGWDIAPKVSLKPGLQIGLTLASALTSAPPKSGNGASPQSGNGAPVVSSSLTVVGSVAATFDIAGVELPIYLGASSGATSLWTFGLQPAQIVTLPSFSDLLSLAGGADFFASLPSGLQDIPQIEIDKLLVQFDPATKNLTLLSFALQTGSSWPVIAGYFEIEQLSFAFDITNLTLPANRQVIGDMGATFKVGSVPLMVRLQNTATDQDWTITAGLAPGGVLSLTDVAAQLFEGQATLPDGVPVVAFNVLQIMVNPAQQSFAFNAGSNSEWQLIGEDLAIESIALSFSRTKTETGSAVKGSVASTLLIAGVTLNLSASLNDTPSGGWQFSGTQDTAPIPIGQLIQDLANIFGDVTLPTILTGLNIHNLSVDFNTSTKDFTFSCVLKDDAVPNLSLNIDISITHKTTTEYQAEFSGTAHYVSEGIQLDFTLDFVEAVAAAGKSSTTIATYNAVKPPTLSQFLQMVSNDLEFDVDLPGALNFDADLKSLTLELDKNLTDPLRIETAGLFELSFGDNDSWKLYLSHTNNSYFQNLGKTTRASGKDGKPAYVLGVALSGALDLSNLPLVGSIPGVGDFSIDKLGFYYTNAAFTTANNKLIFAVAELGTDTKLAPDPAAAFLDQPGFNLLALFGNQVNQSQNQTPNAMPLGTSTGTPPPSTPPSFATTPADPRKPISWLAVNKTLGPVSLDKVGLSFASPPKGADGQLGTVGLYIDGGFTLAGLSLILQGLGITFPLPVPGKAIANPLDQIGFHLQGLFLEFKEPGLEIAGGFLTLPGDGVNMIGEFIVQAGPFGVQGYGGFAGSISDPSLFIFLHLDAPLGGPPFFFVTGVSGGFGVNRGFKLPDISQLATYPLLPAAPAIPTASGLASQTNEQKLQTMTNSLLGLAEYFPVEEGQFWFAIGLDVTSFEMIEVSAILSISFGVNLQIAVIGSAIMTLPVEVPDPIAYVQINFEAAYSSEDELLTVMGVLTPASYVLEGLVRISGGFAFCTWLAGPNAGDFVLTIGGYSSAYPPPAHYPLVPRMQMRAGIGIVNMVGEAYFALLPNAIMAGIDVHVTADLGPISAWFYAGADFFMGWKPFQYTAEVGIAIGASFTIDLGFVKTKITIHVGVMLSLWGPAFGGQAVVDLDIISFTIKFGAGQQPAPALSWEDFKDFLPSVAAPAAPRLKAAALADEAPANDSADKPLVNLTIKKGLLKAFTADDKVDGLDWLVDANHFEIRTESTAPCTVVNYNGDILPRDYNYLEPGDLRAQIAAPAHESQEPPYYVYATPAGATAWFDQAFGIPPMEKTNVSIVHKVTMVQLPLASPTKVEDVIITLTTGAVPPSLWGNEPVSAKAAPDPAKSTINNALIGLQFTPMIWFPRRTTFIPYYYLVFDTNNLFLDQATAPVINPAPFANPQAIYTSMQNGSAFAATQTQRAGIVAALQALGFSNLELKNADALSTQDYVDDPMLTFMSSTQEINFSGQVGA